MAEQGYFGPTRLARDMRKFGGEYIGCSDAGTQVIVSARDYECFSKVFRDAKYASWWLQTHSEYVVNLYRPKGK